MSLYDLMVQARFRKFWSWQGGRVDTSHPFSAWNLDMFRSNLLDLFILGQDLSACHMIF